MSGWRAPFCAHSTARGLPQGTGSLHSHDEVDVFDKYMKTRIPSLKCDRSAHTPHKYGVHDRLNRGSPKRAQARRRAHNKTGARLFDGKKTRGFSQLQIGIALWLSIDFGSIKFFGATILAVLMIFGIKSGGPPFFHDELDASLLGHVLDFQFWPAGPASPSPPPKPENFGNLTEKS